MSTISQHTAAMEVADSQVPAGKPVIYVASIGDPSIYHHDAKVLPIPRALAVKLIAKRSHRLAKPEEIAAYDAEEQKAKHAAESTRSLPISAETIAAVARAVNSEQKPAKDGK
jgi:hypothetical protein